MSPLGSSHMMKMQPDQKAALNSFLRQKGEAVVSGDLKVKTFYRVEKGGQTFFSALYTRVQRRNSYTVSYGINSERFGCIQIFFQYKGVLFALIRKVEVAQNDSLLSVPDGATIEVRNSLERHARATANTFTMAMSCKETNNLEVVEVCQVLRKCVLLECGTEGTFLSTIPNFVESD